MTIASLPSFRRVIRLLSSVVAVLPVALGLCSCGAPHNGFGQLVVSPSAVTVTMGASIPFAATLNGAAPAGVFHWSVSPAAGGTITDQGMYTAANTGGDYTVFVTLVSSEGVRYSGTAAVRVLPTRQSEAVVTADLLQASGAAQAGGAIQNASIVGEPIAATVSSDATGRILLRHGFKPPMPCASRNGIVNQPCTPD